MSHDNSTQRKKKSVEEEHLDEVAGHSHHFIKAYDGGKCLWRGIHEHKAHSCSYRYQAIGKANEDKLVYNWPAYKDAEGGKVKTNYQAATAEKKAYPHWYRPELEAPTAQRKDWDIKGKNFKTSGKPYWNQAHHLIPVGALHKALWNLAMDLAESRLDAGMETLVSAAPVVLYIGESLLRAEYNINHKNNMLLLPMDNAVSDILRLPKHGGPNSSHHVRYNKLIEDELDKIMDVFRNNFSTLPNKEHLTDDDRKTQKRRLELLSERLLQAPDERLPTRRSGNEPAADGWAFSGREGGLFEEETG
ncbi:AHH domain-containing protein [Archangium sp.]|uniref:AHH domain-containing protein n=1 Tax=Archangium sp. TaxID=1872627 RepID=UPI002D263391|nr:AHH domain-containing protein [Archangium sp.]HYO55245.1 AHH domain-containing protein [Archangium sp.]